MFNSIFGRLIGHLIAWLVLHYDPVIGVALNVIRFSAVTLPITGKLMCPYYSIIVSQDRPSGTILYLCTAYSVLLRCL